MRTTSTGSAPERLHRFVDAVRDADELEERVVGQGPLDVEGVEALDGHERSDEGFGHGATYLASGSNSPG